MSSRLQAVLSLRWNYSLKGCWVWLKGRQVLSCGNCGGSGFVAKRTYMEGRRSLCPSCCDGIFKRWGKRGYQRILSEPERVVAEQEAVAEGVFV